MHVVLSLFELLSFSLSLTFIDTFSSLRDAVPSMDGMFDDDVDDDDEEDDAGSEGDGTDGDGEEGGEGEETAEELPVIDREPESDDTILLESPAPSPAPSPDVTASGKFKYANKPLGKKKQKSLKRVRSLLPLPLLNSSVLISSQMNRAIEAFEAMDEDSAERKRRVPLQGRNNHEKNNHQGATFPSLP